MYYQNTSIPFETHSRIELNLSVKAFLIPRLNPHPIPPTQHQQQIMYLKKNSVVFTDTMWCALFLCTSDMYV